MARSPDTSLCSALGIDAPVVQAPIGNVSTPELAAAVAALETAADAVVR